MSRRASLPGAAELSGPPARWRTSRNRSATWPQSPARSSATATRPPCSRPRRRAAAYARRPAAAPAQDDRRPSGRERHDEKITVYVSADELFDLEQARLVLRGEHGLAVDRGRIVREALAVVIADLESRGESSTLVRRLREG